MDIPAIAAALRSYVRKEFEVADTDSEFSDDVHLFDYGYVDSFGAVKLISFIESEFAVKVTDGDLVLCPLNTISEIASFVHGRMNGG